jgi:diadenosine tetraphosphate (Ap4A) HIT family hydrolase
VRESFAHREAGCIFCEPPRERLVTENELAYVLWDGYPVTDLHALVVPKRHQALYFDLAQSEINAVNALIADMRTRIVERDPDVQGFNIGVNAGEAAGQTVLHCHVHLIPRRSGDVPNPRGGVRNTVPGRGDYTQGGKPGDDD